GASGPVSLKLAGTTPTASQTQSFSAGAFKFTPGLLVGSGWTVTVNTPPPGQVCTVTNGSGSNVAANVSNVSVDCVSAYSIGGTIAGAGGVSLKLDSTTPTTTQTQLFGAGGFAFTTPLLGGSGWNVTVNSVPPGQGCTVTNGSGSNLAGNVSNVA